MKEIRKIIAANEKLSQSFQIAAEIERFKSEYQLNLLNSRESFFSLQSFVDNFSTATGAFNLILNNNYETIATPSVFPDIAKNLFTSYIELISEQNNGSSLYGNVFDYDLYDENYGVILRRLSFEIGSEKYFWIAAAFIDNYQPKIKSLINVARSLNISYKRFEYEFLGINRIHISKYFESLYLIKVFLNDFSRVIENSLGYISRTENFDTGLVSKQGYFLPFEILPLPSILIVNDNKIKLNKNALSLFKLEKSDDLNFENLETYIYSFSEIYRKITRHLKDDKYFEIDIEAKDSKNNKLYLKARAFSQNNINEVLICLMLIDNNEVIELTQKNELLHLAIEKLPEYFIIANSKGNIIYANESFYKLFNLSRKNVINENYFELRKNLVKSKNDEKIKNYLSKQGYWSGKQIALDEKGKEFTIETKIIEIRDKSQKRIAILEIGADISEKIALEEKLKIVSHTAEKAQKIKNDFLAQISHEIRTPLNAILSFVSLLKEKLIEEKIYDDNYDEYFDSIDKGAERLIRTIDLMVGMSQLQTGNYNAVKEKVYINSLLLALKDFYQPKAAAKNLTFEVNVLEDDYYFYADSYSIYCILENLIDNAIKFTNNGFVRVKAYVNEAERLAVEVADSGIGISKEYLNELFEPFSQEEKGYTRKFDGNGLGLAISKKYADLNNCEIKVVSEKNKGSVFTLIVNKEIKVD